MVLSVLLPGFQNVREVLAPFLVVQQLWLRLVRVVIYRVVDFGR